MTRPRCPRGHFLPRTGTCRCTHTRQQLRRDADLWGQGLTARQRHTIRDIPLTGSYL
jgi:hypothetical protein